MSPDIKLRRDSCYVQPPMKFDIAACECGNVDVQWSEFKNHLWCESCHKDFIPTHWGILDGPIPYGASKLFGISFIRYNLTNGKLMYPHFGEYEIVYTESE